MKKRAPVFGLLLVALLVVTAWTMHRSSVSTGAGLAAENCGDCHDLTDKKKIEKGPYLWGIVNRRAASIPDFEYSQAFREFAAQRRFAWSEANLDLFIAAPDQLIPGTKMAGEDQESKHAKAFERMRDRESRRTLIAYLRSLK